MAFLRTPSFQRVDMRELVAPGDADRGDVASESATQFVVVYEDGRVGTYTGNFTVSGGEVIGGNATAYAESINGSEVFAIGDFDVPLFDFETSLLGGTLGTLFETQIFNGNDTLDGGGLDDYLFGYAGDDAFEGKGGNDTLDGMTGVDTARYADTIDGYKISILANGQVEITDIDGAGDSEEGTDTLINVERLLFDDDQDGPGQTYFLDIFSGISDISESEIRLFVEMYIAYFDRAPDAEGLAYWGTRLSEGMTYGEIATSFFVQPETVARYPDPNDSAALVDAVYQNVLERAPDDAGRLFWIGELENGNVSRGEFILAIIDGAKNFNDPDATPELIAQAQADVQTITDKADIGVYYAAINGLGDPFGNAGAVMDGYDVDDREGSLAQAQQQIDSFAAESSDGFTLQLVGLIDDPFAVG